MLRVQAAEMIKDTGIPLISSTLLGIPMKLCCVPDCDIHKRKRHYRKRGQRGGYRVHLKRLRFGLKEPIDCLTTLGFNLESYYGRPCVPELGLLCMDCGSLEGDCCKSGCFVRRFSAPGSTFPRYSCPDCVLPISQRAKPTHWCSKHQAEKGKPRESSTPYLWSVFKITDGHVFVFTKVVW